MSCHIYRCFHANLLTTTLLFSQFPDKPVCDKDTNRCVQCKANANCKDEVLKYCDVPNTTCVECRADARECFL